MWVVLMPVPCLHMGCLLGRLTGQKQQMQMQYTKDQLRQELQQRSFLSHAQVGFTHDISPVAVASCKWV